MSNIETSTAPAVMILGANGRFGRCAVQAFNEAGWQVIAQSRSEPRWNLPQGVVHLGCDALDTSTLITTAKRYAVEVIVHGLNPPYDDWERQVPALTDTVLSLASSTGALLMLPGNVYNFGNQLPSVLTEETPQVGNTSKARQRIELEQRMQSAPGVRSVVIRAGDFIGGSGPGTWIDMVIAKRLDKNELVYPGPLNVEHAWAYLPDLAHTFVQVANRRTQWPRFSAFNYAGLTLTGSELCAAIQTAVGRPLKIKPMPWWLVRIAGVFSGMMRALLEMRYLWNRPHTLDESRLAKLIGDVPRTSVKQVVEQSLAAAGKS